VITFVQPIWLVALLIVPIAVWWSLRSENHKPSLRYSSIGVLAGATDTWRVRMRHVPLTLRGIALALAILALARPVERDVIVEENIEGIDIILALDISGSMRAPDFYPNRFEAARGVAAEFVQSRTADRVGLVVFAGQAFTQVPLTVDYRFVLQMLDQVRMGMTEDGTAIGNAIAVSANRLKDSETESKVVILLTDGQNNRGEIDPFTAAEVAAALGVRLYAVGIGMTASMMAEQEVAGGAGGPIEVDEDALRAIAETTGGRYFHGRDREGLRAIYDEIDQLERSVIDTSTEHREYSRFAFFLLPAIGLILLEVLLSSTLLRSWP
jgi:Ca-activated chloride channel homolog